MNLAHARKATAAALGGLASILAAGLIPAPWDAVSAAVIAVATAYGVYQVPNDPA